MASDTYYKDMWLRRNKTAIQVVIVLLSVIAVILIIQTSYRRHPGMGHALHGANRDVIDDTINIRGRVFGNDDDFDPGAEDDDLAAGVNDRKSDCCTVYDLWQYNRDDFECSPLNNLDPELPPALVCFYPEPAKNDKYARIDPETSRQILKQLSRGGNTYGFIDLGAGLGAYTFLAASLEHNAVAVEPNANNIARFHKAAKLGRYERYITLLNNQVGASRDEIQVAEGQPKVKQILMDDIPAFCKFRKAIMRMNLGGEEHRAFQYAKYLFKEIQITYVYFDWINLKQLKSDRDLRLVSDMIQYFNKRGYVPRGYDGKVLSTKKWQQWPHSIYWQKM